MWASFHTEVMYLSVNIISVSQCRFTVVLLQSRFATSRFATNQSRFDTHLKLIRYKPKSIRYKLRSINHSFDLLKKDRLYNKPDLRATDY